MDGMTELKDIIRKLRAMAVRADSVARRLELRRTDSMVSKNAAAVVGLAQIGTACRDFHSSITDAVKALPPGIAP